MKRERVASLCLIILIYVVFVGAVPKPHHKIEDIVMVEDIVGVNPSKSVDSNVALVTLSESKSSEEDSVSSSREDNASDDLIFLTHKSQTATEAAQAAAHVDASVSVSSSQEDVEEEASSPIVAPIDMSAFVALIPTQQVQAIATEYYRHDAEVQRAYVFLNSGYFAEKKQQLIQLPEVLAFTRYLNASGLDVLQLTKNVILTIRPPSTTLPLPAEDNSNTACSDLPLDSPEQTNSTREQVKGLQGLVDSVLEALPQDQILATFFDKIEADQQFSKLIDSIGTPKFSKILSNLQNSEPLRNQLAELQKCRINILQIVESLKSYFFLSSF